MGLGHTSARAVLLQAFTAAGLTATPTVAQAVQAIAHLESSYGAGRATNNWGSIQCSHGPPCVPGECVELEDRHPDGSVYVYCYRIYTDPVAGALGLVRAIWRRPAMVEALPTGSALAIATAGRYGTPIYHETDPQKYAQGIAARAAVIAQELGEPVLVTMAGQPQPGPVEPPSSPGGDALGVLLVGGGLLLLYAGWRATK